MDRGRAAFIQKMAEKALKNHKVVRPPVDVFAIAAAQGLLVQEVSGQPPGHCGWLQGMAIGYRAEDSPVRRRFTIAHELGHHFLGHAYARDEQPSVDVPPPEYDDLLPTRSPLEAEANTFAEELLMPFFLLQPALRQLRSPQRAAELFQVSLQAMFIAIERKSALRRIIS